MLRKTLGIPEEMMAVLEKVAAEWHHNGIYSSRRFGYAYRATFKTTWADVVRVAVERCIKEGTLAEHPSYSPD